jgi:DNA-binding transcriptional ArsR family regulator
LTADDETELEYALRGKAWKVYWFMLKNGKPVSVREVQRALRFSSPSVANHHLEQLRELGLVEKQDVGGHYVLVSQVKIGVLAAQPDLFLPEYKGIADAGLGTQA